LTAFSGTFSKRRDDFECGRVVSYAPQLQKKDKGKKGCEIQGQVQRHRALIWNHMLSLGCKQLFDMSATSSGWCGNLATLVEKQGTDFLGKTLEWISPL